MRAASRVRAMDQVRATIGRASLVAGVIPFVASIVAAQDHREIHDDGIEVIDETRTSATDGGADAAESAGVATDAASTTTADGTTESAASDAIVRPKFNSLRFMEDWSGLRGADLSATGDPWDRIKYVPLSDDGSIWASFGGQLQLRMESWNNFAFGAPANDSDTFLLARALLHADVHFGENLRVFVEGKAAGATDRDLPGGRRALDIDVLALEQAFADLRLPLGADATLTIRPGRQQFRFGKQRLVSPLPWANTQRRWDGVDTILDVGSFTVHAFWSQFVPVLKYDFNKGDRHTQFYGAYATTPIADTGVGLDLYFLGLDRRDSVSFNGTSGPERRYTAGARLASSGCGFDVDVEGAYQFGSVGAGDVDAYMFGGELGYQFEWSRTNPRFFVGFDYGSGDREAGGDVQTFNQLYPLGHAFMGYMDFVGRQNIVDLSVGATIEPIDRLKIGVTGHFFQLAQDGDALYNAGGAVVRPGMPGASRTVGQEIDVTIKYAFDRHLAGLLGYSHFFPGSFLEQTGSAESMDFFYLQLQYSF